MYAYNYSYVDGYNHCGVILTEVKILLRVTKLGDILLDMKKTSGYGILRLSIG